jgi:hypothetical protein
MPPGKMMQAMNELTFVSRQITEQLDIVSTVIAGFVCADAATGMPASRRKINSLKIFIVFFLPNAWKSEKIHA